MISDCWHFLSVNASFLAALSQHTMKTTTCSSINPYKFHSEFFSAETNEIWLLHYLKITEKFQTKGEHFLFLRLTEDNLPNYTHKLQTFRWSKQNIPRIQNICACITLYYGRKFKRISLQQITRGGWGKFDWTYSQNCNLFTNLSIVFHCLILTRKKYTLGFRFRSNPKWGGVMQFLISST